MKNSNQNPWAGLASYEDPSKSERKLKFCGRDNDIYDVARMIDDNLLLILYGKSGIGKTSLLNAGVFPKLRLEQYLPVSLRLGTLEDGASFQEAIISAVKNAVEEVHGITNTYPVVEEQTDNQHPDRLWNYFARNHFSDAEQRPLFPVVVLDQFEEVLRNNDSEQGRKAQTLLNQLQYIIDESHSLSDCVVGGKEYFYDFNFRFVISIREDELYLLEDNIDDLSLSKFRDCRYRLRSLSVQGATEAVLVPGNDCIAEEEKQDVVGRIIELSKRPQSNDIDTLLLSLVCAGTYEKKAGEKITVSDLAVWKSNPMEVYYQDAIKGLNANQIRYIQQHFIREDGSRRRVDEKEAVKALGMYTLNDLNDGKNRMLIRTEHGQVELLHDQLALAVYEERKNEEEKERKKKQRQKQVRNAGGIGLFVVLIASIVAVFMFVQLAQKNQSRFVAEKTKSIAEEDSYLARMLSIEVLPEDLNHPGRPYTPEAEYSLRNAWKYNTAVLNGHNSTVNSACFSPDGKQILSSSYDGTIRIWDAESGATKFVFSSVNKGHGYTCAVYNHIGESIAAASTDNKIYIWNLRDEQFELVPPLIGHTGVVNTVAFSPNGKQIVSASNDSTVRIWEVESRELTHTFIGHCADVNCAVFSRDGKRVISSSFIDRTIRIWDVETHKEACPPIKGINSYFINLNYNDDGTLIVAASNKEVVIIDYENGVVIKQFDGGKEGHKDVIRNATFSKDDKRIITTSLDGTVKVWDFESEVVEHTFTGHLKSVTSVAMNPEGKQLVSASWDRTIRMWDLSFLDGYDIVRDSLTKDIENESGSLQFIRLSPNNQTALFTTRNTNTNMAYLWELKTKNVVKVLSVSGFKKDISAIAFSQDSKMIAIGSRDRTIRILDASSGKELKTFYVGVDVCSLSLSPDDKQIVIGSKENIYAPRGVEKIVCVFDIEKEKLIEEPFVGHDGYIYSVAYSPDGKQILSASSDSTIRIWDVIRHKQIGYPLQHDNAVYCVSYSLDGKTIVSASGNTIYIWNATNGRLLNKIYGHTSTVNSVAFSEDGNYIISASSDKTTRVWDLHTTKEIMVCHGHDQRVVAANFDLKHNQIITASTDGTIRFWEYHPLQDLIDQTRERFKDRPLTAEERKMYYLE